MTHPDRTARGERGFTLVELALAMFVLGLVAAGAGGVLTSVNRAAFASDRSGAAREDAVAALRVLESDVRSGAIVSGTAADGLGCESGGCLQVFVTRPDGTGRCVEWRLDGRALERRSWPAPAGTASVWQEVLEGLAVADAASDTSTFRVDPLSGGRTVEVTLFLAGADGGAGEPVRVETSVTARGGAVASAASCGLPT
jgi:prepilin-type N-terminal cleavage/methylation domain-containing protein